MNNLKTLSGLVGKPDVLIYTPNQNSKWCREVFPMIDYLTVFSTKQKDIEDEHRGAILFCISPGVDELKTIDALFEISKKYPKKVVACFMEAYNGRVFNDVTWKSMQDSMRLLGTDNISVCESLREAAQLVNMKCMR